MAVEGAAMADVAAPRFRVLGSFEIGNDGARTSLTGAKQRAIVALLLTEAGRVVPADRLIDGVWGDEPPASVRSALQVNIAGARKALDGVGLGGCLRTRAPGYVLDAEPHTVDLHLFQDLDQRARAARREGDAAGALDAARRALSLWRGEPFADVGGAPFSTGLTTALRETRVDLVEMVADLEIERGRCRSVVADLEVLVAEFPYRESAWERLARALYLSGRQADALDRLAVVRRLLLDQLGLSPGPALAALEVAILNHDPSIAALAGAVPGPRVEVPGSRLPAPRALVGRKDLVDRVLSELQRSRLVTLVGPPGVGKTSIAAHVIARAAMADGVIFVDLTTVEADATVLSAVGSALGMQSDQTVTRESIVELVGGRHLMITIDNCEHVIDAAADLVDHLLAGTSASVLATSQERLDISGETVILVDPLGRDSAVEVFVAAARAARADFELDDGDEERVAAICNRVDGVPLAIELVAVRVRSLDVAHIAAELDDAALLVAGRRGGDRRHHSLHAMISWSYGLLPPARQSLLRRMSVFASGADVEALIAVCADHDRRVGGEDVLDAVHGLVSRSLVVAEHTSDGVRFRLLSVIRIFAAQRLHDTGEAAAVQHRFQAHVIAWAHARRPALTSADPAPATRALEREVGNIRAARAAMLASGDHVGAARLLAAFGPAGLMAHGLIAEFRSWVDEACGVADLDDETRIGVLCAAVWEPFLTADEYQPLIDEVFALARRNGDVTAEMLAWHGVANLHLDVDPDEVERASLEALALAPAVGVPVYEGNVANCLANVLIRRRRLDDAAALLDRLLTGDTERFGFVEAHLWYQRGRIALEQDRVDDAAAAFRRSEVAALRTGSAYGLGYACFGFGLLGRRTGDLRAAMDGFLRSLDIGVVVSPAETVHDRFNVATVAADLGDLVAANEQLRLMALSRGANPMWLDTAAAHVARASGDMSAVLDHARRALPVAGEIMVSGLVLMLLDDVAFAVEHPAPEVSAALRALAADLRAGAVSVDAAAASAVELLPG